MAEMLSLTGNPVRGAGWYGRPAALHTVVIRVVNLRGRVAVQGASVAVPQDSDWLSLLPDAVPYIQYPRPDYVIPPNNAGETSITSCNYTGNIVWLRASFDRTYLISPFTAPRDIMLYGTVEYVMVNY